ncbi:hypothetical protein YW7DRAFT_05114 [Streptomyces sp. AmelKG-E11A]|nr:hypothetical protein YW7DRAFT_05114 [Streptomyces sp. AmelKG-E11A]
MSWTDRNATAVSSGTGRAASGRVATASPKACHSTYAVVSDSISISTSGSSTGALSKCRMGFVRERP